MGKITAALCILRGGHYPMRVTGAGLYCRECGSRIGKK